MKNHFCHRALKLTFTSILTSTFVTPAQALEQHCQDNIANSISANRYKVQDNGSIIDQKTHLMWQACTVGLSGPDCRKGQALSFTWGDALQYTAHYNNKENKHDTPWRLPNVRELSSIIELRCARPAIQASIFKNTPSAQHWSSSPYQFYPHYSWYVNFEDGVFSYDDRTEQKHIRLVRDI